MSFIAIAKAKLTLSSIVVLTAEQALEKDGLKGTASAALITVGVMTVLGAVCVFQRTVRARPFPIERG